MSGKEIKDLETILDQLFDAYNKYNRDTIGLTLEGFGHYIKHKKQANEVATSQDKALDLDGVSDVLPLEYDKLPDKLQKELFKRHEHMEIPNGSDCIVYKERDVLELLQMVDRGDYR